MKVTIRQLRQLIREQVEEVYATMQQTDKITGQFGGWTAEAEAHLQDFIRKVKDEGVKGWVIQNIAGVGTIDPRTAKVLNRAGLFKRKGGAVRTPVEIKKALGMAPANIKSNPEFQTLTRELLDSMERSIELSPEAERRAGQLQAQQAVADKYGGTRTSRARDARRGNSDNS